MRITVCFLTGIFITFAAGNCAFSKTLPQNDINKRIEYVNIAFWEQFEDEYLKNYILCAVKNNHEAKSTLYKSEQFRQEMKSSFADELPSLNVAANYLGLKIPMLDNFAFKKNGFVLPFQFNYEADLLLKNRDKTKSKHKLHKAQKYDEKSAYIMLAGDVATTYINILKFDKTISLQEKLLKNREEILKRTENKFYFGTISKTELNNGIKDYNTAYEELEELLKQRSLLLDNLALLIAQSAQNSSELKRGDIDNFAKNLLIPLEISSDKIFTRPDVQSALYKLQSAKIDITVAKKDFFPTFNITGFYVFNTLGPGNFFSWRSTFAALIAGAAQDIFTGGKKIASLRLKKARYDELFENFLQTDLNAIKEVNDALYQTRHDIKIYNEAKNIYAIHKNNFELEEKRFTQGTVDFISLLEENIDFIDSNQNLLEKKAQKFVDVVSLYKAAGGNL
ncbi:TPA: TolC family protein [Candidatus Galligastranaerophilus faecipullorum]|nr:TolC family protein [Candidatus Galligastranaerophilus faecipullorum]